MSADCLAVTASWNHQIFRRIFRWESVVRKLPPDKLKGFPERLGGGKKRCFCAGWVERMLFYPGNRVVWNTSLGAFFDSGSWEEKSSSEENITPLTSQAWIDSLIFPMKKKEKISLRCSWRSNWKPCFLRLKKCSMGVKESHEEQRRFLFWWKIAASGIRL